MAERGERGTRGSQQFGFLPRERPNLWRGPDGHRPKRHSEKGHKGPLVFMAKRGERGTRGSQQFGFLPRERPNLWRGPDGHRPKRHSEKGRKGPLVFMAEREGFEPSEHVSVHLISSQARSANSGTSPGCQILIQA